MRILLGAIGAAIVWLGVTVGVEPRPAPTYTPVTTTTSVCAEDMECWDCSTMGNLICGEETR